MKRKNTQLVDRGLYRRKNQNVFDKILHNAIIPNKHFWFMREMLCSGEEMDTSLMLQWLGEVEKNYDDFRYAYMDMKKAREFQKIRCEDAWKEVYFMRKRMKDNFENTMVDLAKDDGKLVTTVKKKYPDINTEQLEVVRDCVWLHASQYFHFDTKYRSEVRSLYVLAGIALLTKNI